MARTYAEAVRNGTAAASKLLRRLDWQAKLEAEPGAVDIFAIIAELDLPLMLRPLKGLLGAFLKVPTPGILVTTQRPLSIQRFTAAHELGHCLLDHEPSLDDEDQILRRAPRAQDARTGFQETEADAFAVALMMPKWLILAHCARQGWRVPHLEQADNVFHRRGAGEVSEASSILDEAFPAEPGQSLPNGAGAEFQRCGDIGHR